LKLLPKSRRDAFTERLMENREVMAPAGGQGRDASFTLLDSADMVDWEYSNDHYPPKRFLFPPTENLFEYRTEGKVSISGARMGNGPSTLLCLRSCDATAIAFLDRFFLDSYEDTCYAVRRRNFSLITLTCAEPYEGCFCLSCDAGPALASGFDLQLTDLGEDYLLETGGQCGRGLLSSVGDLLSPARESHLKKREEVIAAARAGFSLRPDMNVAVEAVTYGNISGLMDELSLRCFECMGCTNLCPTCSCFDTSELCIADDRYRRYRYWDSCQLAGFTREAGDGNPRPDAASRLRRWYFHKLSRRYVEINGRMGCVGCGRCDRTCLGDLQMLTFLRKGGALDF
jgi:ferredoxin